MNHFKMDQNTQKLTEHFEQLPGIGTRQARRFVYFLLDKEKEYLDELAQSISSLKEKTARCQSCRRFFESNSDNKCPVCKSASRDRKILLITEKDVDLSSIEKAGFYNGHYYVLGGLMPSIGTKLPEEVKMKELFEKVRNGASEIKEIILAFSATPEADATTRYIEKILEPITQKRAIKISRLGRGLSTGTELEYSDTSTLENAFKNRQ